jgi:hypothetical protein
LAEANWRLLRNNPFNHALDPNVTQYIFSLLAQLVFPQSAGYASVFLDNMLIFLESSNANFVAVAFIMVFAFYLTLSIIKGSVFFSHSIPFLTIHPIV